MTNPAIQKKTMSSTHTWIMWGLASLFYAYQYILRVLPNIMMPEIMEKFQIEAGLFGQFIGVYYLTYSLMHIPIGMLFDRLGPKIVMPICILMTAIGLLPIIYTDFWLYPIIGRAIIGIGSSGAILGVFKIIRMGFPEEKFTRLLGISVTIGLIGAINGGQPINYLLKMFEWERVLGLFALGSIFFAIACYFAIPKSDPYNKTESTSIWSDVKAVLGNRMVLAVCLLAGIMVGPLEGFADGWSTEFLKSVYQMGSDLASTIPSFIFFGMAFGASFLSYVAEKTKAYYPITILAAIIMAACFGIIFTGHPSSTSLMVLFFVIGTLCAYQILMIYKASTYVTEKQAGLTTACANMIIMTFGSVFHSLIGGLMEFQSAGTVVAGVPFYSPQAFINSIAIIPLSLVVAAVGYALIYRRERRI